MDKGLLLQTAVYLATVAFTVGAALYRIKALEKKVEAHNDLVVRMAKAEQSIKSAHHRLDRLEG